MTHMWLISDWIWDIRLISDPDETRYGLLWLISDSDRIQYELYDSYLSLSQGWVQIRICICKYKYKYKYGVFVFVFERIWQPIFVFVFEKIWWPVFVFVFVFEKIWRPVFVFVFVFEKIWHVVFVFVFEKKSQICIFLFERGICKYTMNQHIKKTQNNLLDRIFYFKLFYIDKISV